MSHPLEFIPAGSRRSAFWLFAVLTALLLAVEGAISLKLNNSAAPYGILSLELASSPERLNQIVTSWAEKPRMAMVFSLGLNFICLVALINTVALACLLATSRIAFPFSRLGSMLAWVQWLAGAVWATQAALLAWGVLEHSTSLSTMASVAFSMVKFALVGAGVLFAITAWLLATVGPQWLTARPASS